jgi:hypothetical protein
MAVPTETFVESYERAVEALPSLLDQWAGVDEDLREEYVDQIRWLLEHRSEWVEAGFRDRVTQANAKLEPLWPRIAEVMGAGRFDDIREPAGSV